MVSLSMVQMQLRMLFFNKSASDLNLLETAALVAAIRNTFFKSISSPQQSKENTQQLLTRLLKDGVITNSNMMRLIFPNCPKKV